MVQFDNYRLGYDMTSALLEHGHRHIAFMHMPPERLHNSIHDRRRGWEAALRRQGAAIPDSYRRWPLAHLTPRLPQLERENYEPIARDLLALDPRPDAVITWTDELAALLTRALQRQGVAVPKEIRVCGFDNVERLFEPAFPTSTPDFQRLGALAMDLLARAIEGEDIHRRTYYLPVEVLWREPIPLPRTAEEAIAASRAVD
jgi:DNA-binding LacI/PurR family transcriptional regulator